MIAEGVIVLVPVLVVEREIVVTTPAVEIEAEVGIETIGAVVGAEIETENPLTAVTVATAEKGTGQGTVTEVGARKGEGREMRNSRVEAG